MTQIYLRLFECSVPQFVCTVPQFVCIVLQFVYNLYALCRNLYATCMHCAATCIGLISMSRLGMAHIRAISNEIALVSQICTERGKGQRAAYSQRRDAYVAPIAPCLVVSRRCGCALRTANSCT